MRVAEARVRRPKNPVKIARLRIRQVRLVESHEGACRGLVQPGQFEREPVGFKFDVATVGVAHWDQEQTRDPSQCHQQGERRDGQQIGDTPFRAITANQGPPGSIDREEAHQCENRGNRQPARTWPST